MIRWLTRAVGELVSLRHRRRSERELDEEFQYHLEREIQERQQAGLTAEAARRAARLAMGAIETNKEDCRDLLVGQRVANSVGRIRQDVRFALRLFRRHPVPVAIAVVGLALAIGIATGVFSIINAVALRGDGIVNRDDLFRVSLTQNGGRATPWRYADFVRLQQARPEVGLAASDWYTGSFKGTLYPGASAQNLSYQWVTAISGSYFSVLGGRVAIGRQLAPTDDLPGAPRALVLGYSFWKNWLDADPAVVGRTIDVAGVTYTVVGVADRVFTGPAPPGTPAPAAWISLNAMMEAKRAAQAAQIQDRTSMVAALRAKTVRTSAEQQRLDDFEYVLGRASPLVDYVSVFVRAPEGMRERTRWALASTTVALLDGEPSRATAVQMLPLDDREARVLGVGVTVLMVAVGFVVLLASANVANLLLAGAVGRQREIATRLALGATRMGVGRQLMTESLALGAIAGATGFGAALWLTPALAWVAYLPPALDVEPDLRVYMFVTSLAVLMSVASGIAPARHGARGDLLSSIKSDRLGARQGRLSGNRLRQVLIGAQTTCAVLLLVVAALLTRSLAHAAGFDFGFDPDRIFNVDIGNATNGRAWDPARRRAFWDAALERVRQIPGVESASLASIAPLGSVSASQRLPDGRLTKRHETSADYFGTVGARILRGRTYTDAEVRANAPVAVLSARLARDYWGDDDPIGSSLHRVWGNDDPPGAQERPQRKPAGTRVIGVVEDTATSLYSAELPTLFLPVRMSAVPRLVVRVRDEPRTRAPAIEEALRAVDPDVDTRIEFATDGRTREIEPLRIRATLGVIVGLGALALAVIGLFGVTVFVLRQRHHEIGVRLTLGATRRDIVAMLLRSSLTPVGIGLAAGLGLAIVSGRVLESALFGVNADDPIAMSSAAAILLIASLIAIVPTARRAARVNLADMLRDL